MSGRAPHLDAPDEPNARQPSSDRPTDRGNVVATALVMASTFVSRLLGFVRIAVVGAIFGASGFSLMATPGD